MSGPKVISIITREEIIAICERHLARLDVVIAEWIRSGTRNGTITDEDIAAVNARRESLKRLLSEDRFVELQKQVPAEISFLQADAQRRLQKAAAAAIERRQAARRNERTARMLLVALKTAGKSISEDLRKTLETGQEVSLEKAISQGVRTTFGRTNPCGFRKAEGACCQIRKRPKANDALRMDSAPICPCDGENVIQIDRHLAELSQLETDPTDFELRAKAIAPEPSSAKRDLLADGLLLDLASAVKKARDKVAILSELTQTNAELTRLASNETAPLIAEIETALSRRDENVAPSLIQRANALLVEETQAMAAAARRRAVLEALSKLGYEATEGMATAWVKDGRVVLRKAANREYGLEIGGGSHSDKLQVRTVAFGAPSAPRDRSRDKDMETIWCGELERLQSLIANAGGGIKIEKAMAAGSTPIKVIEDFPEVEADVVRRPMQNIRL